MQLFGFLFVGLAILELRTVEAVRCFECRHYPSPALCTDITTCSSDQDCYVEEVVTTGGLVLYNSGCITKNRCSALSSLAGKRNTDITACQVCCHGDLCNNEGCSKTAIPRDQRGPYCYSCDLMTRPDQCDKLQICGQDELCLLRIPHEFLAFPEPVYRAECQSRDSCAVLPGIQGICPPSCCETDFCNDHCVNTTITTPKTTTTPPMTTATTTKDGSTTTATTVLTETSAIIDTTPARTTASETTEEMLETTTKLLTTKSTTARRTRPTTTTKPTTTTHGPKCGDHFKYIPSIDFCIKIHTNKKTWANARHDCLNDEGDLLVYKTDRQRRVLTEYLENNLPRHHADEYWIGLADPQNNEHFSFVTDEKVVHGMWKDGHRDRDENCGRATISRDLLWSDTPYDQFWIGLADPQNNEHFSFVTDEKVGHPMWKAGQPDDRNENCGRATLSAELRWSDTPCGGNFSYICQMKPLW